MNMPNRLWFRWLAYWTTPRQQRRWWNLAILPLALGIVAALPSESRAQPGAAGSDAGASDAGASDLLSRVRSQTTNLIEQLNQFPTSDLQLRALTEYELQLDQRQDRRELTGSELAAERYQVAQRYWNLRDFGSAARLGYSIIDSSGPSKESAKAWFLLGMMQYGNFGNPAGAVEPFENARAVLRQLDAGDPEIAKLRGKVLGHTGDLHFVMDHDQDAIGCFNELLADERVAAATDTNGLLNARLQMARIQERQGNLDEARRHQENAYELVTQSPDMQGDFLLGLSLERARRRWPRADDPNRIRELERLWSDPRLRDQPELFQVGNELSFHYFFAGAAPGPRAPDFVTEFLERIKPWMEREKLAAQSDSLQDSLVAYYGQNLLLGVEGARLRRDPRLTQQRLADFRAFFTERTFTPRLAADCPREQVLKFGALARSHLLNVAKLKQPNPDEPPRPHSPPNAPGPEPTPARRRIAQ